MYLLINGNALPSRAVERRTQKNFGVSYSIWWNRIDPIIDTYDKINEVLEDLDNTIIYKETQKGCITVATLSTLGEGYFIRKCKGDPNNIEVCGCREDENGDMRLFRYKVSQNYDRDFGALDAWIEFQLLVKEKTGYRLNDIFGGLPREYHQYRTCVPSPINWAHSYYRMKRGSVAEDCIKADICSAYGTEASKLLPECRISKGKVVKGRVEPTEELPFAFYLESGHMAIWNEGDTMTLNESEYITCDHTKMIFPNEDTTLLLPAANVSLRDVFETLYEGRKDNPDNKFIMNATIGMFHRKKSRLDSENLWPIAAAIKFRCNKRIVNMCEWLKERYQVPILINTDSIMWQGCLIDEMAEVFAEDKKLGNFTYEYKNCRAVIRSSKIYQIEDCETGEVITRWSGSHTKKYTSQLSFGQIWYEKVYEFLRDLEDSNTIRWDDRTRRFINRKGDIYTNTENLYEQEAAKWQNKQD